MLFAFSALLTVAAAIKLSPYGDVIAARTGLGGMLCGCCISEGWWFSGKQHTHATSPYTGDGMFR